MHRAPVEREFMWNDGKPIKTTTMQAKTPQCWRSELSRPPEELDHMFRRLVQFLGVPALGHRRVDEGLRELGETWGAGETEMKHVDM